MQETTDKVTDKVIEKLDEIKLGMETKVAEQFKSFEEKQEDVIQELRDQIANVEAKSIQAPALIREQPKTIAQDCGRRALEHFKKFSSGNIPFAEKNEYKIQLWESVDEHEAYQLERKMLRLQEASALTGSGSGKGGMVRYQPFFRARRFSNNLRDIAPVYATDGSDFQWRVRIGNSGLSFGYIITQNNAANNEDTLIWQIPMKTINTVFPIRSTFLQDTASGGYESVLMEDLINEQSNFELQSAIRNNDQTGSATAGGLGGTDGLRGIIGSYSGGNATYNGGTTSPAAYGSSGTATTNGLHTLATYDQKTSNGNTVGNNNITYQDVVNLANAVDINYWDPMNKFYVGVFMVPALRGLTDNNGRPIWIDGLRMNDGFNVDKGAGYVGQMLGHDVYVSPYLDTPWSLTPAAGTVSKYPIYYGNWDEGFNTVDSLNLVLRRYDQTLPGSITYYLERRMITSVRQPFALVRLRSTATASS